jgi:hypothetical protein
MKNRILVVGHDELLPVVRLILLNQHWEASHLRPQSALGQLQIEPPDLLVLSDTLSADEIQKLIAVCRFHFPQVLLLALEARAGSLQNLRVDACVGSTPASFVHLLSTIEFLLTESASAGRLIS